MPSRLSSLLVRDGLVGVKRMEKAFQRQVIYGGSLDTILLEMSLVPEERLTQYLALASGLPPAARNEGAAIDPAAVALIPRELAEQYRAVPVALQGEAIRILVCDPLEITELEDLADQLDRPLQPLITPEYRWHLAYAVAYTLDPPARYTTLSRALDVDPVSAPVGRARTVIIEDRPSAPRAAVPAPVPAPVAPVETMRVESLAEPRPVDDAVPVAAPTPPRGVTVPRRAQTAPIITTGRESALPVVRARELLATAEDRDTVFLTLLRAARARARWAGLLTVQGGAAIGRVALADPELDTAAVTTVLIPLDAPSPFRTVVSTHQPHIGPITTHDPSIDTMCLRFGGTMPPSALIMPIVLRERVIALVLAHRLHMDTRMVDVTEILPLATAASDALGRLIVKHKSAGYRAPAETPVPEAVPELDTTKHTKPAAPDAGAWTAPAQLSPAAAGLIEKDVDVAVEPEPLRAIDAVLDQIEGAREGHADGAITEAVERAPETLSALMRRFPGKLRVDRLAVAGRPLRASQYGGLLELVVALGSIAAELLIEKMSAPQRDVRFYATVCCAELRPRNAVFALAERLFDQDFGVRACAIEALAGYPMTDLGHALVRARRAVHSSDPEVVGAATAAIRELADVGAIPDLIGVIERGDRAGEHARRALVSLTAQDFGTSERKWRKWYDGARARHRIQWLVEGLLHKEDEIREHAINELRRLTGEYFGYHHDLPRKEREIAAERWAIWWREHGQRRFTSAVPDDERIRPTAVLPTRKD